MSKPHPAGSPVRRRRARWKIGVGLLVLGGAMAWFHVPSRALNWKARELLFEYKLDRALGWLQTSATIDPWWPETQFLLARTYRKQGEARAMLHALDRYLKLGGNPETVRTEQLLYAVYGGDLREKLEAMDSLLINPAGDEREILEAYVNGLMSNVRFEEAYAIIGEWKKAFPDDPLPYYARGRAAEHFRDGELAKREYEAAIERQPDHARSLFALGRLHSSVNEFDKAKEYYHLCMQSTLDAAPRIGYANCLFELGELQAARQEIAKVTQQPPDLLKKSYQRVGERLVGRPDAELSAKIEMALNNEEVALEWFEIAHKANPAKLDLRYSRALALRESGRTEEALREITAVGEARKMLSEVDRLIDGIDPNAPELESRLRIAEIYMKHGSRETAEYWLKSILAFNPNHPRATEMLAGYYSALAQEDSRYAAAAEEFKQRMQRAQQ